jgi:hypothetical protein
MDSRRDRLAFSDFISEVTKGLSGVALVEMVLSGACLSSRVVMVVLKRVRYEVRSDAVDE